MSGTSSWATACPASVIAASRGVAGLPEVREPPAVAVYGQGVGLWRVASKQVGQAA
ncbi:hypothetical protein M878_44150 [Streptomyces roseochromogenus subsp. oscitans DS 12.976]|uniref:Uncharacterized protein n=1 Tax=Streptomyces roseochromogenus subsp. oscitans DS 12.976 TaxID=1352936 RepID=V6JIE4_STRRC|nr:hypothetical protein M878_44150 [Streptomyces roseochromogenus subsp. oscitans DS 12.976]